MNGPDPNSRVAFARIEREIAAHGSSVDDPPPQSQQHRQSIAWARDQVFRLGSIVGQLCSSFLIVPRDFTNDGTTSNGESKDDSFWSTASPFKDELAKQLGNIFLELFAMASLCGIDLRTSILKKVELNGRKYPVDLCKVSCVAAICDVLLE